jgi:hypothetical protein
VLRLGRFALRYTMKSGAWVLLCFSLLVCAHPTAANQAESDTNFQDGAWLQEGVNWTRAPKDINPQLESGGAEVLYIEKYLIFAAIYCTVLREHRANMAISHGDPQTVYLGLWDSDKISVRYRLVSRTVRLKGEELPGPFQHAIIKVSKGILIFDDKRFHRVPSLDESAAEVVRANARIADPGMIM